MKRNLNELYIAALDCIQTHPAIIQTHIMQKTGINVTQLMRLLKELIARKFVEETTEPPKKHGSHYRVSKRKRYHITDNGKLVVKLYEQWVRALSGNVEASTNSQPSPFSANSERVVNSPLRGD